MTSSEHQLITTGVLPEGDFLQFVRNGSLLDAWADIDIWHVRGNLGFIGILLSNPHYKARFLDGDMRPSDAYGCALHYLFQPSAEMKSYIASEFRVMSSDWLTVGIQIRLGDSRFDGEDSPRELLPSVMHFFDCAQYLIDTHRQPQQKAIMFLISDSLSVRQEAMHAFGDQLVTKLDQPGHVAREGSPRQAMIQAAGEHWLFGMADFHVISAFGSFGRSGALRSRQWHSVYSLDVASNSGELCGGGPLDFDQLARRAPYT